MRDADELFARVVQPIRIRVFVKLVPEPEERVPVGWEALVAGVAHEDQMPRGRPHHADRFFLHVESQDERCLIGVAGEGLALHRVAHGGAVRAQHSPELGRADPELADEGACERLVCREPCLERDRKHVVRADLEPKHGPLQPQTA